MKQWCWWCTTDKRDLYVYILNTILWGKVHTFSDGTLCRCYAAAVPLCVELVYSWYHKIISNKLEHTDCILAHKSPNSCNDAFAILYFPGYVP